MCEKKIFCLRAVPRAYIGLIGLTSIPFILSLVLVSNGASDAYEFAAWSGLLPAYWLIWLVWFRLEVDHNSIRYRRPFRREESLQWEEVKSVEIKKTFSKHTSRIGAPFSTVIITTTDRTNILFINTRIFSVEEMKDCVMYMKAMIERRSNC